MSTKESIASDYIFFRFPADHVLVIIPIIVGSVSFFFNNTIFNFQNDDDIIVTRQNELINDYLLFSKFALVILISFFVTYRWSNMIGDGTYGYWITQGVRRKSIIFYSLGRFLINLFSAQVIGLLLIIFVGGLEYDLLTVFYMTILILSNAWMLLILAFLIANIVRNPEFAALTYILVLGLIIAGGLLSSSDWIKVLQSDRQYNSDAPLLWFLLTLASSFIIILVTIRYHVRKDLDL
ncbi:MAG: hypothetical protein ACXAD7_01380 [Candidatus Kariarchaeaceae archaeon]|jgi:hypothetical protein